MIPREIKWWMFLPFVFINTRLASIWIFEPNKYQEKAGRFLFVFLMNTIWMMALGLCFVSCFVL